MRQKPSPVAEGSSSTGRTTSSAGGGRARRWRTCSATSSDGGVRMQVLGLRYLYGNGNGFDLLSGRKPLLGFRFPKNPGPGAPG